MKMKLLFLIVAVAMSITAMAQDGVAAALAGKGAIRSDAGLGTFTFKGIKNQQGRVEGQLEFKLQNDHSHITIVMREAREVNTQGARGEMAGIAIMHIRTAQGVREVRGIAKIQIADLIHNQHDRGGDAEASSDHRRKDKFQISFRSENLDRPFDVGGNVVRGGVEVRGAHHNR